MDYSKLKNTELFLFDMDGTLYLGDEVYNGAIQLMEDLPRLGKRYIYLTNNSSRAAQTILQGSRAWASPARRKTYLPPEWLPACTSIRTIREQRVYLVGTQAFRRELLSYGIQLVEENADVVVVGFDTELVYEKLNKACHFLRRGAVFIAANPDWVCPMPEDEVLPDCGSICALLTASSGREPNYIGKPNRNMIDVISKMTGIPNEHICAVGDRLYTDIAVAQNAGSVSVLVLSGETDKAMVEAAERKPDYVLADVHELHMILKEI